MSVKQGIATAHITGNNYYNDYTTTTSYVERPFGFAARSVTLTNDSDTDPVQFSWDGATQIGEIKGAESKCISAAGKTSIYIKATTGGEKVRVEAE